MPNESKQQNCQKVSPQSKQFIQKVIINVVLTSFMMGYTFVYFNTFKFDDLVEIFELKLDKAFAQGFFTGCIPASAAVGALLSKFVLLNFTRKQSLQVLNFFCIMATLLIQLKSVLLMIVGRLLQGTFIGIGTAVIPLYIKQFIPQMNGKYGLYNQLFFTIGIVWAFSLNFMLNYFFQEANQYWRLCFGFPIAICLYQAYMLCFHYNFETPRYLVSINKNEEAKILLQRIYKDQHIQQELEILYEAAYCQSNPNKYKSQQFKMVRLEKQYKKQNQSQDLEQKLLQKQYQKYSNNSLAVFCAFHLAFQQQIIGIGAVIMYSADIISQAAPSILYFYGIIVNTFGLVCIFLGLYLIQYFGRVTIIHAGAAIIAACLLIAGINFIQPENMNPWIVAISVVLMRGTFSCTLGPIAWLYMAEVVKPNIIPYGTLINWTFATLVMFLFPILSEKLGGPGYIFLINACLCILTMIINALTLVQTKGKNQLMIGQAFEEKYINLKQSKRLCKLF